MFVVSIILMANLTRKQNYTSESAQLKMNWAVLPAFLPTCPGLNFAWVPFPA